jgi:hypothetical protein
VAVILNHSNSPKSSVDRYKTLSDWSSHLNQIQAHIADKSAQKSVIGGGDEMQFMGMSLGNMPPFAGAQKHAAVSGGRLR